MKERTKEEVEKFRQELDEAIDKELQEFEHVYDEIQNEKLPSEKKS